VSIPRRAWVEQIMGMPISVQVRGPLARGPAAEAAVARVFAALRAADAVFSTYLPDSDISRLARGELTLEDCHPDVAEVADLCEQARSRTGGWFDAALVRQTVLTAGIDGIAFTKLDVLDGFDSIKICTGYRLDGREIGHLPASQAAQARLEPVYEDIEGWKTSTHGVRTWQQLPAAAEKYVRRVEELINCPVALLSTSPERDDTILVQNPFQS